MEACRPEGVAMEKISIDVKGRGLAWKRVE
jgi:hypothetical protein